MDSFFSKKEANCVDLVDKLVLNGKTAVVGRNSIQRAAFMHEEDVIQFKEEILSGASRLALKKEGKTQCSKVTGIPQKV